MSSASPVASRAGWGSGGGVKVPVVAAVVLAAAISLTGVLHPVVFEVSILALALFLVMLYAGQRVAVAEDRSWLPRLVVWAFLAKCLGAGLRYAAFETVYRAADARGYYATATGMARQWRSLTVPIEGIPAGTPFVEVFTSLLFVPYVPSPLGAFLMFGALSFLGQLALYAAFRRSLPPAGWRLYALLVFFLPSLLFWPSSIGKEALMVLFIGLACLGAARLFDGAPASSLTPLLTGILGAALIRSHIGLLLVSATIITLLLMRSPRRLGTLPRAAILGLAAVLLVWLASLGQQQFGIEAEAESLESFAEEVSRNTAQGGSEISGSPVRGVDDVPEALVRVLFRPFPHEAHNLQALASSLEGLALLAFLVWRWPRVWRTVRSARSHPYVIFSVVFLISFGIMFSPVLNLGILARQRTQAFPFLLVLMVGVARDARSPGPPARIDGPFLPPPGREIEARSAP